MEITKEKLVEGAKHSLLRTLSVISVLAMVGGLAYGLTFLFRKPNQNIVVGKGGTAQITQINKTSKFFIPFIEGGVEQRSEGKMATYMRGGVRVEF